MPHRYAKIKWIRFKRVIKKLARSHSSAHDLAFGVAIGLFIGMLPIMGIQMLVAAGIAAICRVSKLAAVLPVWISNPFTFIPLYGFNYWVGHKLTGMGPTHNEYRQVIHEIPKIMERTGFVEGIVESTKYFGSMGLDAVISLSVGSLLLGLILAVISYPLTMRAVVFLRVRRARKRQARHERVSKVIRDSERMFAHKEKKH